MSDWLIAAIAVVAGVAVGALSGWLARRSIRDQTTEVHDLARPAATFLFWFFTAVGVVVAVGVLAPGSFDTVPQQILEFLPSVLVSGLILLGSWGLAAIVGRLLRRGVVSASGGSGHAVEVGARVAILSLGTVFALAQLGVDTTVLTILVAGLVLFGALSSSLLVGLGGRQVANELAAGRYLNRHLVAGMRISWIGGEGVVSRLHPAVAEIELDDGRVEFVPYTSLLDGGFSKRS